MSEKIQCNKYEELCIKRNKRGKLSIEKLTRVVKNQGKPGRRETPMG